VEDVSSKEDKAEEAEPHAEPTDEGEHQIMVKEVEIEVEEVKEEEEEELSKKINVEENNKVELEEEEFKEVQSAEEPVAESPVEEIPEKIVETPEDVWEACVEEPIVQEEPVLEEGNGIDCGFTIADLRVPTLHPLNMQMDYSSPRASPAPIQSAGLSFNAVSFVNLPNNGFFSQHRPQSEVPPMAVASPFFETGRGSFRPKPLQNFTIYSGQPVLAAPMASLGQPPVTTSRLASPTEMKFHQMADDDHHL